MNRARTILNLSALGLAMMMGFVAANSVAMGLSNRATALRQPALVASDQAASRLAPTGFDQAQGGVR